jgi:ABC-type Fe3+ transport system substrate-binding protein
MARLALAVAVAVVMTALPEAYASDVTYDKMPDSWSAFMKMTPAERMQMMDPQKKGYVTKKEFMAFHQKMAEKMFEKMDKNHNGKLEQDEFEFEQSTHTGP